MTSPAAAKPTRYPVRVERVVVMTISVMSSLIIYDGWEKLRFFEVVAIIVGPVVAIFASHVFGGVLAERVDLGRSLTRQERARLLVRESTFLLLAGPPLLILVALSAVGVAYVRTVQAIILVGVVSLGFWGGVAGHRAGLAGWRLALCVACGLALGGLTLVLQAVLQPGTDPFAP